MKKISLDLDDPVGLWETAIRCWGQGDEGRVYLLLADESVPVPAVARQWLTEAVAGRLVRKVGRPRARLTAAQEFFAWAMFDYAPPGKELPRTRAGYAEAGKRLGVSPRQIEQLLPRTRKNTRGHKPYAWKAADPVHDPFGLTKPRKAR